MSAAGCPPPCPHHPQPPRTARPARSCSLNEDEVKHAEDPVRIQRNSTSGGCARQSCFSAFASPPPSIVNSQQQCSNEAKRDATLAVLSPLTGLEKELEKESEFNGDLRVRGGKRSGSAPISVRRPAPNTRHPRVGRNLARQVHQTRLGQPHPRFCLLTLRGPGSASPARLQFRCDASLHVSAMRQANGPCG